VRARALHQLSLLTGLTVALTVGALGATVAPAGAVTCAVSSTLSQGSFSPQVRCLEQRLLELGYAIAGGGPDTSFGASTRQAVVAFQKANRLAADGVVGPRTAAALGIWGPAPTSPFAPWATAVAGITVKRGARTVAAAVGREGALVYERAWGATPAARYRLASISKTLTAVTVLSYVESGAIALDAPLVPQLGGYGGIRPVDARLGQATVRQFLSHTAGLGAFDELIERPTSVSSCAATARLVAGRRLAYAPGRYHYSNPGYCFLQLLVEKVSGVRYERAVQVRVWGRLGIVGPHTAGTYERRPGDVGYNVSGGRRYMEAIEGAGGWVASAREVLALFLALDPTQSGPKLLGPDLLAALRSPQPGAPQYGLGIRIFDDGTWGHTGTLPDARDIVVRAPDGTWRVVLSAGPRPASGSSLKPAALTAIAW